MELQPNCIRTVKRANQNDCVISDVSLLKQIQALDFKTVFIRKQPDKQLFNRKEHINRGKKANTKL